MALPKLAKDYYGIFVATAVVAIAIVVGVFTPQFSVMMPSLWVLGLTIGVALLFIIPFVASVRFHSPNIFDGDGNVWSFNDEQLAVVPMYGTHMAVIACTGFDNPKKLLAHENVSGSRTTFLVAPARWVESIGHKRFRLVRAALRRVNMWEAKVLLARPEIREVMDRWEVKNASVFMALWTTPSLLPKTSKIHRVDFERNAAYL